MSYTILSFFFSCYEKPQSTKEPAAEVGLEDLNEVEGCGCGEAGDEVWEPGEREHQPGGGI